MLWVVVDEFTLTIWFDIITKINMSNLVWSWKHTHIECVFQSVPKYKNIWLIEMNENDNLCMFKKNWTQKYYSRKIIKNVSMLMHIPNQYLKNYNKTNNDI